MDSPTTAFAAGEMPLLAPSHCGNSVVRKVSHLYVHTPSLPLAGLYQSV
ncbi:Uncharacterised protein [Mycobacteroides abscessus subsp. abscessus]|nr:Uncharacterised protein [Mycobacteroides abscessus subsp. abscessus]